MYVSNVNLLAVMFYLKQKEKKNVNSNVKKTNKLNLQDIHL